MKWYHGCCPLLGTDMVGSVEAENADKARYKLYLLIVDAYPAIHRPLPGGGHEARPYRIRITDIRVRVGRSTVWYRKEWSPCAPS